MLKKFRSEFAIFECEPMLSSQTLASIGDWRWPVGNIAEKSLLKKIKAGIKGRRGRLMCLDGYLYHRNSRYGC